MAPHRHRARGGGGAVQWLALCGAVLVILSLTFALGLLVGRQWARETSPASAAEPARKAMAASRRGLETAVERLPQVQDRLTFYQTLTAPLGAVPPSAAKPESVPKFDVTPKPSAPEEKAAATERPAERAQLPPAPAKPVALTAPTKAPVDPKGGWTVQAGAFKSRPQAETLQKQLAAAGVEAYVAEVGGGDGQPRWRVRVGSFRTREEAQRAAERMRAERTPAYVAPK